MSAASRLTLALAVLTAGATVASCGRGTVVTWPHLGKLRFAGGGDVRSPRGEWRFWYQNGQLRERGSYQDGHRGGVWTQWFRSAQRANEGERRWSAEARASLREGPWTFWHENGQLRARGEFVAGRREGTWEFWLDSGAVDSQRSGTYKGGERVP